LLVIVVVTALGFDFTNGFHDTANAMATTIATGALKPRIAVGVASVLNFVGAFLSISVAATIAKGIVEQGDVTLEIIFAGLVGAILWNVLTWYLSIPSSSSHADRRHHRIPCWPPSARAASSGRASSRRWQRRR
jgi:PiT family inorganic phosphate transporter